MTKALSTESFVEKLALLIATVLLSGLAVPFVVNGVNQKGAETQKQLDGIRSQNAAIREAQSKLVDEFSATLFTYETLAADVSWFRTKDVKNDALFKRAYDRYSDRMIDLLAKWRSLEARSKALTSPAISAKMHAFQLRMFTEQDTPINALLRKQATDKQWTAQHEANIQMLNEADHLIGEIMNDLGIEKAQLR